METNQTDRAKRDRSRSARLLAKKKRVAKLTAERDREKEHIKALQAIDRQAARKSESRDKVLIGVAALAAARTDPDVRTAVDAATRGLSERERAHLGRDGSLWGQVMAAASTAARDQAPLPIIAVQVADAAGVVRYAELRLAAMSNADLHVTIMDMLGAVYVGDLGRWACADPHFPEVMKSIGRDLDRDLEGLQPEMANRYLTTLRLERASADHPSLDSWDALLEWEDIAARDAWVPGPDPVYVFRHSPQGDTVPDAMVFATLREIVEAEQRDDGQYEIERWTGTWSCGDQTVPVIVVRQAIVLARWASSVSEAGQRVAQGLSARVGADHFRGARTARLEVEGMKADAKIGWARRRSKYGDDN